MSTVGDRVTLAEIAEQRAKGWPDFHPEDFCHTCGFPNPTWHAADWVTVVGSDGGIECPRCFMLREPSATWSVLRSKAADHAEVDTLAEFLTSISGLEGDENRRVASCVVSAGYTRSSVGDRKDAAKAAPPEWFADWCERVDAWHERAFPGESMEQLGLCLAEETGELIRTILKESHGANDRRADTDWKHERMTEFGDVLICLAKIAALDGFDPTTAAEARFAFVADRFPGHADTPKEKP